MFEIYFDDLTKEKQAEFIKVFGNNGNFDVYPIATFATDDDEDDEDRIVQEQVYDGNANGICTD